MDISLLIVQFLYSKVVHYKLKKYKLYQSKQYIINNVTILGVISGYHDEKCAKCHQYYSHDFQSFTVLQHEWNYIFTVHQSKFTLLGFFISLKEQTFKIQFPLYNMWYWKLF